MAFFHHTHCIKSAYDSAPKSNAEPKPNYKRLSLTENGDDIPPPSRNPLSKCAAGVTLIVLLILCINTVADLHVSSEKAKLKIHEMAASLRDEIKHQRHISDHIASSITGKVETFQLVDFYKIDESTGKAKALNTTTYPKDRAVIAMLTTNTTKDVDDAKTALKSLDFLHGDVDSDKPAPVLIFHEGNLNETQKHDLIKSCPRPISFPIVNFTDYPEGLDLSLEGMGKKFVVEGRENPWGYHQMIRFWITTIWRHPALEPFEIVMRMDTDSCFKGINEFLPGFRNEDIVYHSQFVGVEHVSAFMDGLMDHAKQFLHRYHKAAGNPMLWRYAAINWEVSKTLPLFMTNFEVSRKSWMRKNIVMRWHESLTEEEPWGVFTHRWGDAVTRYLMVALLAMNYEVDTSYPDGYFHKENCEKKDVEEALKQYYEFMTESHER